MSDIFLRIFEIVAIFLGVLLRTGVPYLRKKKLGDILQMEMTWIFTAISSFTATWIGIVMIIPIGLDPIMQIIMGFSIAYFGNGIINEAVQWKPVYQFIKTGEKP